MHVAFWRCAHDVRNCACAGIFGEFVDPTAASVGCTDWN